MTWEEKITEAGNRLNPNKDSWFGKSGCCSSNSKHVLIEVIRATERGEAEKLDDLLPKLQKQYEGVKAFYKLVKKYPGRKSIHYDAVGIRKDSDGDIYSDSCCGKTCIPYFERGILNFTMPTWKSGNGSPSSVQADLFLLEVSRLLRDARTRCAKHPKYLQTH